MRTYRQEFHGVKVTAYRDADSWVVQAGDMSEQRFKTKNFTMKEAMEFAARIAAYKEVAVRWGLAERQISNISA